MDDLKAAIARLRAFRDSWNEGDQIDEESKLTADDLDLMLMELEGRFDVSTEPDAGFATNGE